MSSINRRPHCLKREKTLAIPRHFIFFDCETKQEVLANGSIRQRFKLGWACYYYKGHGRHRNKCEWYNFQEALSFWQFIFRHTKPKRKLWVLARHLVFDFTVVEGWKHLRLGGYKLKFFHDAGTTSIISVRSKQSSIVFLDIMNWFVESLAKTGERIGIPKLKIDFATCTDSFLNTYCKRDVEIELENFKRFIKFLEDNSIARLCYTRGSTAMAAYLLGHYRKRIWVHNNKEAIDLERESYRGGRTECFYIGDLENERFSVVDVNSLYPFVMRNNSYPVKYKKITKELSHSDLSSSLEHYSVVAKAMIDTNEPVYAVRRERTIFPVGRFWACLTTPELKYALERGHIVKIEQAVIYEQANIFRTYVDRFYKLRQEFKKVGIAEYEELCKKMLNSLYGKFGQKADVWTKIGDCPNEPDRVEICYISGLNNPKAIRYLLGEIFELTGYGESFNSFPAIASHVAAFGRMYLYKLMKQAGEGNYFYCDTDSLIVNEAGLCNLKDLITSSGLGGLKIDECCEAITIRGLKDYSTESKTVVKGIRKNATEISSGVYSQEQWPSFQGLLRTGQTDGYTVKRVTKVLTREYTKGVVSQAGVVYPHQLDDFADVPHSLF